MVSGGGHPSPLICYPCALRERRVKRPAHLSPGPLVAQTIAPKLTCVEVPSQSTDEGEGT